VFKKLHLGVIHVRAPRMSVRMTAATMIAATGGNMLARCVPMASCRSAKAVGGMRLHTRMTMRFRFGTSASKIVC